MYSYFQKKESIDENALKYKYCFEKDGEQVPPIVIQVHKTKDIYFYDCIHIVI